MLARATSILLVSLHSWLLNAASGAQVACSPLGEPATIRASLSSNWGQPNATSGFAAISANGRWVAFWSSATNLVIPDANGLLGDVFVRDLSMNTLTRVSVSSTGVQGNLGGSSMPDLSADGRYVAFLSGSSNLVPGDTNGATDVFVHDRKLSKTRRVSVSRAGVQGNDQSVAPRLSADGRFVTFHSLASTLAVGDMNGWADVFVHDSATGDTELVSVSSTGQQGDFHAYPGDISGDGRFVAFGSFASNLVIGDNNGFADVFLRDRWTNTTTLISVSSSGQQGNHNSGGLSFISGGIAISGDGRYVAFISLAQNLVPGDNLPWYDVFVRDRLEETTTLVSKSSSGVYANDHAATPSFSASGRAIVFESRATNLIAGGTTESNVYLHDLLAGTTERVGLPDGPPSTAVLGAYYPSVSADGRWIAFTGGGPFVATDTNDVGDIYVRQRDLSAPMNYCAPKSNSTGCEPTIGYIGAPSASAGAGFHIAATDVLPGLAGALAYSLNGSHDAPFAGGTLCVRPPMRFMPRQPATGSVWPPTCSGSYDVDFNAWIASGADPALTAGVEVWAQYMSRDPGLASPDALALSDALTFVVCP